MRDDFELLDTAPLRDQRTMVDIDHPAQAHKTVADVEAAWQRWADREGLTARRRRGDYTTELKTSRKTVVIHISRGKWIGDCPECNGGVPGWPFHTRGACLDCGTIFHLDYPDRAEVEELVELLRVRPESERNYFPHKGETVEHVRMENTVNAYADRPPAGALSIATLRDTLSPDAYAELEKAGLV